jgi:hypothetical protein
MSRNELIDAYRRGRISRRRFVQGMTALGVSAGVAAKMASDLKASPGGGKPAPEHADQVYTPTATATGTATATATATRTATAPTTALPSTGVGDPDSSSSLWKPVAVAGAAAAAFVAAKLRKLRGSETE